MANLSGVLGHLNTVYAFRILMYADVPCEKYLLLSGLEFWKNVIVITMQHVQGGPTLVTRENSLPAKTYKKYIFISNN